MGSSKLSLKKFIRYISTHIMMKTYIYIFICLKFWILFIYTSGQKEISFLQ